MSALAPTLQAFFTDRLTRQRQASPHTIAAYRDTYAAAARLRRSATPASSPAGWTSSDLDAPLIGAFLDHLEHERHNSVRTRNARLAAIHSLFRYAALRHPEHAALIERVLAIPPKRSRPRHSSPSSPKPRSTPCSPRPTGPPGPAGATTPCSLLATQTGLRVSELTGLDLRRCPPRHRRSRQLPSARDASNASRRSPPQPIAVLRVWLTERAGQPERPAVPDQPRAAPSPRRRRTPTRQAHQPPPPRTAHHSPTRGSPRTYCVTPPRCDCCTPASTPPSSRSGSDTRSVETTQIYLHADLTLKEQALARTTPPDSKPGRYQPPDTTARLPREPLIMPTPTQRPPPAERVHRPISA